MVGKSHLLQINEYRKLELAGTEAQAGLEYLLFLFSIRKPLLECIIVRYMDHWTGDI